MDEADRAATRPMRADARRNHDRLVNAAAAAFAEHGTAAPLDDIARRAGVGAGTLYRHFANRDALLAAVYGDRVTAECARAASLAASQAPDEALMLWLRTLIARISERRGLAAAVMAGPATPGDGGSVPSGEPAFAACRSALRETAADLLARAQRAGAVRADMMTEDLLRLAHAVAVATESSPESADRLLAMVVDGLRRTPGGNPAEIPG